jgi:CMP-N-acetylneuraminic acid synthetase
MKKDLKDIAIVVQARLGSQRVPGKMLKPFAGTTLVNILLDKLRHSDIIDPNQVYLSFYEEELKAVAVKYPFVLFNRSKESADSEGSPISEIFQWWDKLDRKYVIMISACNPLLTIETIEKFVLDFINSDKEGAFAVFEKKTYYWDKEGKSLTDWKGACSMNTKFVEPIYEAAHCLYASRLDIIGNGNWVDTNSPWNTELVVMDELEAFDIDYPWQFEVAEVIYKNKNGIHN